MPHIPIRAPSRESVEGTGTLQQARKFVEGLFSPSEAQAELIPLDALAKGVLEEALKSPTRAGEATRRLHSRSEKTKLATQFGPIERLVNVLRPMLGVTSGEGIPEGISRLINLTDPFKSRIALNPEFLIPKTPAAKEFMRKRAVETLGHESGHQLLNTLMPDRKFSKRFEEAVVDLFAGLRPDIEGLSKDEMKQLPKAVIRLDILSRTTQKQK